MSTQETRNEEVMEEAVDEIGSLSSDQEKDQNKSVNKPNKKIKLKKIPGYKTVDKEGFEVEFGGISISSKSRDNDLKETVQIFQGKHLGNKVKLWWSPVEGANQYEIQRELHNYPSLGLEKKSVPLKKREEKFLNLRYERVALTGNHSKEEDGFIDTNSTRQLDLSIKSVNPRHWYRPKDGIRADCEYKYRIRPIFNGLKKGKWQYTVVKFHGNIWYPKIEDIEVLRENDSPPEYIQLTGVVKEE